jgi:antirestriction protein ArdC
VAHGGDTAYFRHDTDHIQMPDEGLFTGTATLTRDEAYYAVLVHELVHNADIQIMPTSAQMSRKSWPPAQRSRHNHRDSGKATDRFRFRSSGVSLQV